MSISDNNLKRKMIVWDQCDQIVAVLAGAFGKPDDHVRLLFCMVLQMPIGLFINLYLRQAVYRNMFNIVVGLIL